MPSLVAEIGDAIESHLRMIGMIQDEDLDEHQKKMIAEKRAQLEAVQSKSEKNSDSDFPAGSELCIKCNTKAMIKMDGCLTCLNCGDSKCG